MEGRTRSLLAFLLLSAGIVLLLYTVSGWTSTPVDQDQNVFMPGSQRGGVRVAPGELRRRSTLTSRAEVEAQSVGRPAGTREGLCSDDAADAQVEALEVLDAGAAGFEVRGGRRLVGGHDSILRSPMVVAYNPADTDAHRCSRDGPPVVYRTEVRIAHIRIGEPVRVKVLTACLKEPRPQ